MKRIKVNLDRITDFDLKLARNPHAVELLEEILPLPLEVRAQRRKHLLDKIHQGQASLFEERVQVKLLEKRTAEWIRLLHKNLPAIEAELTKRSQPPKQPVEKATPPATIQPAPETAPSEEYPSELLEFLAQQKPNPLPTRTSRTSPPQQRTVHWLKDITIGGVLLLSLVVAVWYVMSSPEQSSSALATVEAVQPDAAAEPGLSAQQYQELQGQYDQAAQEVRFGEFEQGQAGLLALIASHPESSFAEHAYLLLADTSRQRRQDPDEALAYYQSFLEKFPQSSQRGVAQLKMGFSYEDIEDRDRAKEMYRLLINTQGEKSRVGQLARERLAGLEKNQGGNL